MSKHRERERHVECGDQKRPVRVWELQVMGTMGCSVPSPGRDVAGPGYRGLCWGVSDLSLKSMGSLGTERHN